MRIAICGNGFVGRSVHNLIHKSHEVILYDLFQWRFTRNLKFIHKTDATFICVPTPTRSKVQITGAIESILDHLNEYNYQGLVIIKSTTLPGYIKYFLDTYKLNIMCCPEFLNQATPYDHHNVEVVGCTDMFQFKKYKEIFGWDDIRFKSTDPVTASMIKYVHNCFGVVKTTYFNEIYDVCEKEKVDYRTVMEILLTVNDNVGKQYTKISADGKRGFAGACFPKDSVAFANTYAIDTLKTAVNKNIRYREKEMKEVL